MYCINLSSSYFIYRSGKNRFYCFNPYPLAVTIGWTMSSYEATEGEDSLIKICADILSGTLETIVEAPFIVSQSVGKD